MGEGDILMAGGTGTAVVMGVVWAASQARLAPRWRPLLAMAVGIGLYMAYTLVGPDATPMLYFQRAILGFMNAAAASGMTVWMKKTGRADA